MRYVIFLCSILIASLKGYAQDSVITGSSKERLKGYRFFFKGESHEFPVENANSLFVLVKGNFLFNYGIAHVFLDGEGAANILFTNNEFRNQVCSIYPFYSLEKTGSKTLATINKYLPSGFRNELGRYPAYSLVSLEEKKIYPGEFKKAQWILVIK